MTNNFDDTQQPADTYFVQRYVRSALRQMTPIPANFVPPRHVLRGMDTGAFVAALTRYQDILRSVYQRIAERPEHTGLDLSPIVPRANEAADKREAKAKASFRRFTDALHSIAVLGQWAGYALRVDARECDEKTAAAAKRGFRGGVAERLLREAGFTFEGLKKNGAFPEANPLFVRYPTDSSILAVLKAFETYNRVSASVFAIIAI